MLNLDSIPLKAFLTELPACPVCKIVFFLKPFEITQKALKETLEYNTILSPLDYVDSDYNVYLLCGQECRDLLSMCLDSFSPTGNIAHLVGGQYDTRA